jgi:hypothetical protein
MVEVKYRSAGRGRIAVAGQGIAEAVTLCRALSFMRLAELLAR